MAAPRKYARRMMAMPENGNKIALGMVPRAAFGDPAIGEGASVTGFQKQERVSPSDAGLALLSSLDGFGERHYFGRFQLSEVEWMLDDPEISVAREIAQAPILGAGDPSFALGEDWVDLAGVDRDEMLDFVDAACGPLWHRFTRNCLTAWDYGWATMEMVWGRAAFRGAAVRRPEDAILLDHLRMNVKHASGRMTAVELRGVEKPIPAANVAWYTYQGNPNKPYGRPRLRACYRAWRASMKLSVRLDVYGKKAGSVIPILRYPEGTATLAGGGTISNADLAAEILGSLGRADGVAMPTNLDGFIRELAQAGITTTNLEAWKLDFLQPSSQFGGDLQILQGIVDKQKVRGYLVPERAALEGEHGTKADAGHAGDIVAAIADRTLEDVAECFNEFVVKPCVALRYGNQYAEAITTTPPRANDRSVETNATILQSILVSPMGGSAIQRIDTDAIMDKVGVPRLKDAPDVGVGYATPDFDLPDGWGVLGADDKMTKVVGGVADRVFKMALEA